MTTLLKEMSNFTMGTITGMGFAQAQVHTVHSRSAEENYFEIIMEIQRGFDPNV